MKKYFQGLILLLLTIAVWGLDVASLQAQTCSPKAVFTYMKDGQQVEEELTEYSGSAPVTGHFTSNVSGEEGFEVRYEWKIYDANNPSNVLVHRFEQDIDYTFTQSGSFLVELQATFIAGEEYILYPEEGEEPVRFSVTVAESKLEMPNAFSPNDDGYNDVYRAKPNHQSIVEFKATIFNRWGQKLFTWDDVNGSWDGKVNGQTVRDGVYYINVVAKGADGVEYKIRKDINVLTRYQNDEKIKN